MNNPLILITNDDGIDAPGLRAAAAAFSQYDLICVAPRLQQSGMSSALSNDPQCGAITEVPFVVGSRKIPAYAVQGTPTLAVAHAILEICDRRPALCVSGINAGANVGRSIRYSGTIGAAFEANNYGIPAMAVSLALPDSGHAPPADWSAAQYFTRILAEELLSKRGQPAQLALLNINVPATATASTPYEFTRQSSQRFYEFINPGARAWSKPYRLQYQIATQSEALEQNGDIACLTQRQHVSVTPLSSDWTCRQDGAYTPADRFTSQRLNKSFQSQSTFVPQVRSAIPAPKLDGAKLVASIIERGADYTEAELWEASPVRIDWQPEQDAIEVLRRLYAPTDKLFIGTRDDTSVEYVLPVDQWIARFDSCKAIPAHIIPSPLTGEQGLTKDGKSSYRDDDCVAQFRFAVVEFDELPRDQQIRFWAGVKLPVVVHIDSGGRYVHGWIRIDAKDAVDWERRVESRLFNILTAAGPSGACKSVTRLSRMPGHFRSEKGRWQRVLYLNPTGGQIIQ